MEGRIIDFGQLGGVAKDEKFGLGWIEREEVSRHPSRDLSDGRFDEVSRGER